MYPHHNFDPKDDFFKTLSWKSRKSLKKLRNIMKYTSTISVRLSQLIFIPMYIICICIYCLLFTSVYLYKFEFLTVESFHVHELFRIIIIVIISLMKCQEI